MSSFGFWPAVQRVTGHPHGQCVRTCYAALLDLPIDAVPDFAPATRAPGVPQLQAERNWLRSRGLDLLILKPGKNGSPPPIPKDVYHLMSVMTPKSQVHGHRVVGRGGKMIHDPNPDGSRITRVKAYMLVVPKTDFAMKP
jgi:hypothetical protein